MESRATSGALSLYARASDGISLCGAGERLVDAVAAARVHEVVVLLTCFAWRGKGNWACCCLLLLFARARAHFAIWWLCAWDGPRTGLRRVQSQYESWPKLAVGAATNKRLLQSILHVVRLASLSTQRH